MIYKEVNEDLFNYHKKGYYLVHCISADFELSAGIAKEFDERFNLRDDLLLGLGDTWWQTYDDSLIGDVLLHRKKRIIDLITKKRYWHKPTLDSMSRALMKMRDACIKKRIEKIAMPKIGCGLDGLNWDEVSSLIVTIFDDLPVEIVICYL